MLLRQVTLRIIGPALLVAIPAFADQVEKSILTNSLGMAFVRIEAGSFAMGQTEGGDWDERPVHDVTISKPFYLGATEVTNAQYEAFDPAHRTLRGKRNLSKGDDEAVIFVTWHEAMAFCRWLSEKEGQPYRLPTEAEWEYACRGGSATAYHTGDALPEAWHKNQKTAESPRPVALTVAQTAPNAWGLHDLHGNVEEWCWDWYGPYEGSPQSDPVGRVDGDFKVTRGGSHNTELAYLRAANRLSTLPEDKHWLLGFRVALGALPDTDAFPKPPPEPWARAVQQSRHDWQDGPPMDQPFFEGPMRYVKVPPGANGPMYARHNHCPALTACPNGDLLAIWYSTRTEPGRELAIVAARLRHGSTEWEPAAPFWDAADRNDHASALLWDNKETLYHFNGLSTDGTWDKLALILRTSTDNGATWSKARLINAEHGRRNMPIAGVFQTRSGAIVLPCDAVTGGEGGSVVHVSLDNGRTWSEQSAGASRPRYELGSSGPRIAGIHAGVVELNDASLFALGRGDSIGGCMPMSQSKDLGKTWTYSASPFPPIGGGQRLVLRRLQEGPLLFISFAQSMTVTDAAGADRTVSGMFGALSFDDAKTWPVRRLITDDGPPRQMHGGGNTRDFVLGPDTAEPRGYLACVQTPDRVIHLISSALHYRFNLAWLQQPMPPATQN